MPTPLEFRAKAATSYNAAADRYDDRANSFWARFGEATVARMRLRPGDRVLDVCCGTGASALPAARAVGPTGHVLAVDIAEHLLVLGWTKAAAAGLTNVEFRPGDMLDIRETDGAFDAVLCVFGIFFVPDMVDATRELWRLTKPGGRLAITTWGERLFEPLDSVFWGAVREVRSDLYRGFNPWERINSPEALQQMFTEAGIPRVAIHYEEGTHRLTRAADWWTLVMGSGYRGTVEHLTGAEREHVRTRCAQYFEMERLSGVEAHVIYASAEKNG